MKNRSDRKSLPIVCFLAAGLCTGQVIADWSGDKLYGGYNQRYGNFPPTDIDQQLSGNTDNEAEESMSQIDNAPLSSSSNQPVSTSNQQVLYPAQNYAEQNFRQPAFDSYNRDRKFTSPGLERHIRNRNEHLRNRNARLNSPWNNRGSNFSAPWNNRGSGFSAPWNNSGSNFSGPWDNNRSSFGGPLNNRGSSFSGPWDNNGSNFSMPWGNNNDSNFSPFGKGSDWSW